jgi:antitoxin ParD1/3/4
VIVRSSLRLLQEQNELKQIRLRELKQEVQKGLDQIDRGEIVDGDEVFRELRERNLKYKQAKAKKK